MAQPSGSIFATTRPSRTPRLSPLSRGESEEKHDRHEANDPAAAPVEFVAATRAAVDRAMAATTKARRVS